MRSLFSVSLAVSLAGVAALGSSVAPVRADALHEAPAATAVESLVDATSAPTTQGHKPASVVRLAQYNDAYRPPADDNAADDGYRAPERYSRTDDVYRPPSSRDEYSGGSSYGSGSAYNSGPPVNSYDRNRDDRGGDAYQGRTAPPSGRYGEPYAPPPGDATARYDADGGYPSPRGPDEYDDRRYYSKNEIIEAGHGFFGSISQGLASVIEHAFKKAGRPNGYILGEDAAGAFVAGLRYGEGRLYTKDAGTHKIYWQGPSVGYDFGGAGSKTMILVYNLRHPSEVYERFGGVEGSAYLVGGVSIQFQKHGDVVMAPIRAGIGLRLGANVGYLKYTRRPTWNPF
ncbi:MAG: DUF1134 domain-containing protein [Hyphomicrobiaceae bacterium]|nr:DUF1134 domain-containing protein [Hyphomicrobiaceae bacterium]